MADGGRGAGGGVAAVHRPGGRTHRAPVGRPPDRARAARRADGPRPRPDRRARSRIPPGHHRARRRDDRRNPRRHHRLGRGHHRHEHPQRRSERIARPWCGALGHERDHVQLLVLDLRPRRPGERAARSGIAPSFAFPENATPELVRADWTPVSRLSVPVVHERDGVQPDGHAAAPALGEDGDDGGVGAVSRHRDPGHRARDQCVAGTCVSDEARRSADARTKTIIEVVVLSVLAIATAWSGYQGAKWGGRQSELYAQASSIRLQADELGTRGGQVLVADATIFTAWLQARHAGDEPLQTELERRFSPDYATAFHRWLATDPFDDPNAPAGPAAMPDFTTADLTQAAQMNTQAGALLTQGSDARDTANEYIRATVLFASVLLLIGIAQRFSVHGVRIAANVLALALLAFALWSVVRLPRI